MTLPVSSSPVALDLATINEVREVVVRELRDQVCAWESKALEAGRQGDYMSATLFQDALTALPIIPDTRTVELPQFHRSEQDRRLDGLATEVASHQPCPEG